MKIVKKLLTVAALAVDAAVIVLSLLLMVAGYPWWGGVALAAAFGSLVAAAWYWGRTPELPVTTGWHVWDEELEDGLSDVERRMLRAGYVRVDSVDAHAAQMIRALSGRSAVLPGHHLITPPRLQHRQDNP